METKNKRTRAWRRHQARRVFKARLKRVGAWQLGPRKLWHEIQDEKGQLSKKIFKKDERFSKIDKSCPKATITLPALKFSAMNLYRILREFLEDCNFYRSLGIISQDRRNIQSFVVYL